MCQSFFDPTPSFSYRVENADVLATDALSKFNTGRYGNLPVMKGRKVKNSENCQDWNHSV